jgi:hypothetical protein
METKPFAPVIETKPVTPVIVTKPVTTVHTDSEPNKLEKLVELTESVVISVPITVKEPTPTIVKPAIDTPATTSNPVVISTPTVTTVISTPTVTTVISTPTVTTVISTPTVTTVISTPTVTNTLVKPAKEIGDAGEITEPKSSLNWRRRETTSILSSRSDSRKDDHPINEKYVPPYLRRSDDARQDSFGGRGRGRETKYNDPRDPRDSRDSRDHRTEETRGREETYQDVRYSRGRGETHQDVRYSRGRGERFDESRHNSYDDSRPSFGRGGGRGRRRDTRYDGSSTITSGSWRKSS